jgi:hypothetical protein
VLFAVASLRAHVLPPLPSVAVILGGIVGFYAAQPPYGAVLGLALVWLGLAAARSRASQLVPPPENRP